MEAAAGRHLIIEYHGCDSDVLDDAVAIERILRDAARAARAHVVACVVHPFSPRGLTAVLVLEESHLSIHTWPERGYAAVDFFTAGDPDPELAHEVLRDALAPTHSERLLLRRGGRLLLRRVPDVASSDEAPAEARRSVYPPTGDETDTE